MKFISHFEQKNIGVNNISVPISVPYLTEIKFARQPNKVLFVKKWKEPVITKVVREMMIWLHV